MTTPPNETPPDSGRLPDATCTAAWYRKRAEEVRYNGKTVSQYNYFLGIAEAIEVTQLNCQPNARGTAAATQPQPDTKDDQ